MEVEFHAWRWLARVFWALTLLALVGVAAWTLVRMPGRDQDPGLEGDGEPTGPGGPEGHADERDEPPPW
jgi:hypothetical protein